MLSLFVVVIGCGSPPPPALSLDGPSRVRVEGLGPVDGPGAVLSDGTHPPDVTWSVEPATVAHVEGSSIVATAPGEAVVTGTWSGQSVAWTLVVEPAMLLVPVDPPARVSVGAQVPLKVEGRIDGKAMPPGQLKWSSSDATVATVADGVVTGVAPGSVYITASGGSSEAMIELEVTP